MSPAVDPAIFLSAFLRMVRRLHGTVAAQTAWLEGLQQQALIGTATTTGEQLANLQDFSASGVSAEGSSTQWLREMSAAEIAALCEIALQRIESDAANGGAGSTPGSNTRGIDFSGQSCVMG